MHHTIKMTVAATAAALALAPVAQAADPATTVYEAEGSNMGICGAFLGTQQKRDDVNRIIRDFGPVLGIANPGELYKVRARQPDSKPPAQECLPRQLPR